jgi:hypothetical protein
MPEELSLKGGVGRRGEQLAVGSDGLFIFFSVISVSFPWLFF